MGHDRSIYPGTESQFVLLKEMTGIGDAMGTTPLPNLPGIACFIAKSYHMPVIVTGPAALVPIEVKVRDGIKDVIPKTLLHPLSKSNRPGNPTPMRVKGSMTVTQGRLVGETALHHLGEIILAQLVIMLMGQLKEFPHRSLIEIIRRGIVIEPRAWRAFLQPYDKEDLSFLQLFASFKSSQGEDIITFNPCPIQSQHLGIVPQGGEILNNFQCQPLERPHGLLHFATATSRRPAVLVIKPGPHTQFLCFGNTSQHALIPFLSKIRSLQALSGMHEKPTDAHLVHLLNLPGQLFLVKMVIPGPEGS